MSFNLDTKRVQSTMKPKVISMDPFAQIQQ